MGCEGSRVTDEERAEMQHNLGLDHIPSVHLHPHHGHHHLEGFKPNELAHSAHKTHHNDPHLHKGHGGDGDDMNWHQLSDAVNHHQEKQKHHGHDIHKEVRDSLVQHHRHGHRDHHNDYHDAYKHTHGTHSNIGGH